MSVRHSGIGYVAGLAIGALCALGAGGDDASLRTNPASPTFLSPRYNGDFVNEIRTDRLSTPHVKFAKPLHGGTVKALFIVPLSGYFTRDVVELDQRLDLEFKAVTVFGGGKFQDDYPYTTAVLGQSPLEKKKELEEKLLDNYDVIVVANFSFDLLPASCRFRLLRQVKEGTGLVMFHLSEPKAPFYQPVAGQSGKDVIGGLGLLKGSGKNASDHAARADQWLRLYGFGSSRVAVVYPGINAPPWVCAMGYAGLYQPGLYDLPMQIAAKAILWAAGRTPAAAVACDLADGSAFSNPDALPVHFTVTPRMAEAKGTFTLEWFVKDAAGEQECDGKTDAAEKAGISLPGLKAGAHLLTYVLKDREGKVVDFGSASFAVVRDSTLTLAAERDAFLPSETAEIKLHVENPRLETALELKANDAYGRLFWRKDLAPATNILVQVPLADALGRYARITAELRHGSNVLVRAEKELFIRKAKGLEFVRLMWSHPGDSRGHFLNDLAGRQLARAGENYGMLFFRNGSDGVAKARDFCRTDTGWMVYAAHVNTGTIPSSFDPAARNGMEKGLESMARSLSGYGTYLYSLGDENGYGGDIKGKMLEGYREFLKRRYGGDIARLNRLWNTSYPDFAQCEALDANARTEGVPPPRRFDQEKFHEWAYADTHHWMAAAIRRGDPEAKVGAEGSMSGDLELTVSKLDWWAPYEGRTVNEMLKYWMPTTHRGNWWGAYTANHGARGGTPILWSQMLSGSVNASMFFHATVSSEGMFATDLWYAEFYERMIEDLKFIQHGPGALLKNAQVVDGGVAVFWSMDNEHASNLLPEFGSCQASLNELISALQKRGVGVRFLTQTQLAQSGVPESTKLLLLPLSQIVPEPIVPALTAYVDRGGVLVADVVPGTVSPHMEKTGYSTAIQTLFGVGVNGPIPKCVKVPVDIQVAPDGKDPIVLKATEVPADATVVAAQAQPLAVAGTAPVFFVNRIGKGSACLLNMELGKLMAVPDNAVAASLLKMAGIAPAFTTRSNNWRCVARFRMADALLLGMQRDTNEADEIGVGGQRLIVDLKNNRRLGIMDKAPIGSGRQFLFAFLPPQERAVDLKTASSTAQGERLRFSCRVLSGGKEVAGSLLRADLYNPDGRLHEHYTTLAFSGEDSREMAIPLAFDDPPGKWRLTVTELSSGTCGEARFALVGSGRE